MLLETMGPDAVTTAAIARHIGVSQPTFYAHFTSLDDFHDQLLDALTAPVETWLAGLHASLLELEADTFAHVVAHFTRVLDLVDAHRSFVRLFLNHRRAPTGLGPRLRAFEARVHAEVESHTLDTIARQGFDPDLLAPQAGLFASALTPIIFGLLERYLDGALSRPMCAKLLGSQNLALSAHIFRGQILTPHTS